MDKGRGRGRLTARWAEFAVALIVVAVFAALVMPALRTANRHRAIALLAANGERLWGAIVRANRRAEASEEMSPMWPTNRNVGATEYFVGFFESDLYTNAFPADWLAAPGVPVFSGTNTADFAESNNAWCVSVPFPGQTNDFPFLFSRNFVSEEDERGGSIINIKELNPDSVPFGADVGIVVSYRGVVQVIKADDLGEEVKLSSLFNPTAATNQFLTPPVRKKWRRRRRK